jgi:uncharacterized protein
VKGAAAGLGLALACTLASAQEARVSRLGEYRGYAPLLYTEQLRQSVYLTLRDGTRLAADIHRPAAQGRPVDTPYPVLWQPSLMRRAPADQGNDSVTRRMPELVRYGYVVVEVERRGLGASFGARRGYNDRTEARDAFEITQWLAAQSWSSGQVGVYGCSNTGDAAMHAAGSAPPALKAVFAGCFSWNKYDAFRRGGLQAQWGLGPERPLEEQLRNAQPVDGDEDRSLLRQAIEEHRDSTPLAEMWRGMPFRDSWSDLVASRFWLEGSVSTRRDALRRGGAAFYIWGGWMDEFRREGLVAWANLKDQPARIVIGPWMHCRHPGLDMLAEAHRFFDRWLKGVDNGIDHEPPLQLHATNAGWKAYASWPPSAPPQRWVLALGAGEEHALAPSPGAVAHKALTVRPLAPCPDHAALTQPCSQAAGALRFTSPPLRADTPLTGHPLVQLWVDSPEPDQNVFAYLEDLAPDGSTTVVSEGRLKASHRATHQPPYPYLGLPWQRSLEGDHEPLQAGQAVKLHFDLLPLSHVFKAGHRLRVVISGNDPRERPTAPTGHALTLHSSAARLSSIELPVAEPAARHQP